MSYAQTVCLCLSGWITHLLTAVPTRSRATFVELLCGSLISPESWVTRAISAITRGRHWTTYYKLLERGSVRTLPEKRERYPILFFPPVSSLRDVVRYLGKYSSA